MLIATHGCVAKEYMLSGVEGPKMIIQYFNVYALRRVHCAGYATGLNLLTTHRDR